MKSLIFSLLCVIAGAANATTYYVADCGAGASGACVAGNDLNTGTSASAPWKTCAKVAARFASLAAGDKVLFARGSAQDACKLNFLSNQNSRAANPVVLGAYTPSWADSTTAAPILNGLPTAYGISLANSGVATHDEGYVIQDLHLVGSGTTSLMSAIFMSNDVDHVVIERVEIEGYRHAIQCEGGTRNSVGAGSDGLTDHITIRQSNIHHNRGMGILLSCNSTLIEKNRFDNNGVGMLDHHIYLHDAALNNVALPTKQVVIRSNTLTNNSPYASHTATSPTVGGCRAVAIVVHGLKDGIVIENNTLAEPSAPLLSPCWGISVDSGGYTGIYAREGFTNVTIRGNTVINYSLGIGVDLCDRCLVENNYVYSEQAGSAGIVAPSKYNIAAIAGNTLNNKLVVRNNTVYLKNPSAGSVGIRLSRDGGNHVVVSNLVYFAAGTSTTACFNTSGLLPGAFSAFDHNLCHFAGVQGTWDASRTTLSQQRAAGLDLNSSAADPGIAPPTAPNYILSLSPNSPAVRSGHPSLSSEFAIGGVRRNAAADVGAIQQGASIVVPSFPTAMRIQ